MSKLDLTKVKGALDDVLNGKNQWTLLKHEGTTNKVIEVESGDDLRDSIDELSDGTLMYALYRFNINDATKFVAMGYCPEGIANQIFKGNFNNWYKDFEFHLKGKFHLSVTCRNEEDVDFDAWTKKLKIGAGSSYTQTSNKKEITIAQAKQNIATHNKEVKKTEVSIDKSQQEEFWKKQQQELKRQEELKNQKVDRSQDYSKTNERKEYWSKNQQEESTTKSIPTSTSRVNEIQQLKKNSEEYWKNQQQEPVNTTSTTTSVEQKPPVVRGNKDLFKKFENMSMENKEQEKPRAPVSTGAVKKLAPPTFLQQQQPKEEVYHHQQQEEEEQAPVEEEVQQQEEEEEEVQQPVFTKPPKPQGFMDKQISKNPPTFEEEHVEQEEEQPPVQEEEEVVEEEPPVVVQQPKVTKLPPPPVPKSKKQELVALFDFEPNDDEELPFVEGDVLYLVREEGDWWLAENESGRQGFIPSNYVEKR
ncbi:hypothetical protein ABK040_014593 [Willaertia magna]